MKPNYTGVMVAPNTADPEDDFPVGIFLKVRRQRFIFPEERWEKLIALSDFGEAMDFANHIADKLKCHPVEVSYP